MRRVLQNALYSSVVVSLAVLFFQRNNLDAIWIAAIIIASFVAAFSSNWIAYTNGFPPYHDDEIDQGDS